nr:MULTISPECIES: response regulator [unclassified Brevibacterium]
MVVDDEPMVRNFVGGYLDTVPAIEVVGTAANGAEALEQYALHYPEVVLMDLAMPVMDGFEATARLAALAPAPTIAVLTTLDAGDDVARAVAAGAVGYIFKN